MPQEAEFLIHPNSYLPGESHLGAPALPHLQVGTWEAGLNKHITGTEPNGVAGEPRALLLVTVSPEPLLLGLTQVLGGVNSTQHVPAPAG